MNEIDVIKEYELAKNVLNKCTGMLSNIHKINSEIKWKNFTMINLHDVSLMSGSETLSNKANSFIIIEKIYLSNDGTKTALDIRNDYLKKTKENSDFNELLGSYLKANISIDVFDPYALKNNFNKIKNIRNQCLKRIEQMQPIVDEKNKEAEKDNQPINMVIDIDTTNSEKSKKDDKASDIVNVNPQDISVVGNNEYEKKENKIDKDVVDVVENVYKNKYISDTWEQGDSLESDISRNRLEKNAKNLLDYTDFRRKEIDSEKAFLLYATNSSVSKLQDDYVDMKKTRDMYERIIENGTIGKKSDSELISMIRKNMKKVAEFEEKLKNTNDKNSNDALYYKYMINELKDKNLLLSDRKFSGVSIKEAKRITRELDEKMFDVKNILIAKKDGNMSSYYRKLGTLVDEEIRLNKLKPNKIEYAVGSVRMHITQVFSGIKNKYNSINGKSYSEVKQKCKNYLVKKLSEKNPEYDLNDVQNVDSLLKRL